MFVQPPKPSLYQTFMAVSVGRSIEAKNLDDLFKANICEMKNWPVVDFLIGRMPPDEAFHGAMEARINSEDEEFRSRAFQLMLVLLDKLPANFRSYKAMSAFGQADNDQEKHQAIRKAINNIKSHDSMDESAIATIDDSGKQTESPLMIMELIEGAYALVFEGESNSIPDAITMQDIDSLLVIVASMLDEIAPEMRYVIACAIADRAIAPEDKIRFLGIVNDNLDFTEPETAYEKAVEIFEFAKEAYDNANEGAFKEQAAALQEKALGKAAGLIFLLPEDRRSEATVEIFEKAQNFPEIQERVMSFNPSHNEEMDAEEFLGHIRNLMSGPAPAN